jgi:hypothetical protein
MPSNFLSNAFLVTLFCAATAVAAPVLTPHNLSASAYESSVNVTTTNPGGQWQCEFPPSGSRTVSAGSTWCAATCGNAADGGFGITFQSTNNDDYAVEIGNSGCGSISGSLSSTYDDDGEQHIKYGEAAPGDLAVTFTCKNSFEDCHIDLQAAALCCVTGPCTWPP